MKIIVRLGMFISILLIACSIFAPFRPPVFAATDPVDMCNDPNVTTEVQEAAGCFGNSNAVSDVITNILYSIILISGVIAAVFVVIGGIKYITSSGDPGQIKTAKNTILYALIGMAIAVLAFAIVNATIGAIESGSSGSASDQQQDDNNQSTTSRQVADYYRSDNGDNQSNSSNQSSKPSRTVHLLSETKVGADKTFTLRPRFYPPLEEGETLTYKSSNPSVASVDQSGNVKTKKAGKATITVTASDGTSSEVEVTVTPPVLASEVILSTGDFTLNKGETKSVTATVFPQNATNKTVTWSSNKKSVATVNKSGVITAKGKGTAKITAKTSNGKKATITVTVKEDTASTLQITKELQENLRRYHQNNYVNNMVSCEYDGGLGNHSCGIAAYLAAAYALTGKHINYVDFAEEGCRTGFYNGDISDYQYVLYPQRGSTFYEDKYGVKVRGLNSSLGEDPEVAWDRIVKQLKKGNVTLNLVTPPGIFTSGTHWIVTMAYREDNGGEVFVWSPNNAYGRSKTNPSNCNEMGCWYTKQEYIANALTGISENNQKPFAHYMYKVKK